MKSSIVAFALLNLCLMGSSFLLTPSMIEKVSEELKQYQNNNVDTSDLPSGSGSTANPVKGIANATSGYLVSNATEGARLFYVFYACRGLNPGQKASDVPIVIWLQGGPGASSQLGNFFELGPYSLVYDPDTKQYKEQKRAKSWNDDYNILIIDNPRGVGYSIANNHYVSNEDEVASDFVNAMVEFYNLAAFQQYQSTPLFVFGESYGGHYVPSVSKGILEYNANPSNITIPIKGCGVGDGWTDPINQLANYDLFSFSLGLVDYAGRVKTQYYQTTGKANINRGNFEAALNDFDSLTNTIVAAGGNLNVYNIRVFGDYDLSPIVKFMNQQDTCTRYNVGASVCGKFQAVNINVYNALSNDFMQSVADRVAFVLEKIPVLLYNGQLDLIVNAPSAENWIHNLNWSGQSGFYNSKMNNWMLKNGTDAGFTKTFGNLHFNLVNKAGHLAPMDQIESTIEMLNNFIGSVL